VAELWLTDERGVARDTFEAGDTILVAGRGLKPATCYEFILRAPSVRPRSPDRPLGTIVTDRHGTFHAAPLLPYFGLIGTSDGAQRLLTIDHAEKLVGGRRFAVRVTAQGNKRPTASATFTMARKGRLPRATVVDTHGRLATGFVAGESDLIVALRHLKPGCVRAFLVPRQFRWAPGDPIDPVRSRSGAPVVATARVPADGALVLTLWPRREMHPGNYQVIVRTFVPGWFEADADYLLPTDLLPSSRMSAVVIRRPPDLGGIFENGVVLTPEITGRPLAHAPYFQFVNNFPKGTDVWAAIDPNALPPGLVSQRAAIYVIAHKTAAQWTLSNALVDISGPGMSPAVKIVPIVPGCINWNETLVWPNPQTPGKYDLVVDFGANAADPAQFATDGTLDAPFDMIDGYVRVGFWITEDPSLPGPFAGAIGQHSYDLGSITVPKTDTGPTPTDTVPVRAVVRYPATSTGPDMPVASGTFPLVVIMHGNSSMQTSYLGYNYLLDHLAGHGFIAMSIHAPVGVMIQTRARTILHHIGVMAANNTAPGLFQGHIELSKIGIAGHSRGGEAVVRAAQINTAEGLGWNIKSAISIAPTDYNHYGDPGVPLLVIYGSNDGDVSGEWPNRTCFVIYDESARPRSFVFVYGGTHDRFNTEWASIEASVEFNLEISPSDIPKLISLDDHKNLAKGYVTAFYQVHLHGKDEQKEYFTTQLRPSLVSSLKIHTSHQEPGALQLDNFEQMNPSINTLGGTVTTTSLPLAPGEDQLHTLDNHSPHVTSGGAIAWNSLQGVYRSKVPAAHKDVSAFKVLSFRATQKYGSASNPANQPQDLKVGLKDLGGKSRSLRVSVFTDIPYPYERGFATRIKSALKSVRIPLESYTIANLGKDPVDLTNLDSVSFEFAATSSGELEIDDVEFGL
jgi:Cutinase